MSTKLLRSTQFSDKDFKVVGTDLKALTASFNIDRTSISIPVVGATPFGPPTDPHDNATAIEYFSDAIRFWVYTSGAWSHLGDYQPVVGETNTMTNIGTGDGIYYQKTGSEFELKTLKAGTNVSIVATATEITISSSDTGEANTGSSLGAGTAIFAQKSGVDLQFKSLVGGSGFNLTNDANTVTINYTETGEANTGANLGAGTGVFAQMSGDVLQFKSIVQGTGMSITSDANTITLSSTGEANTGSNVGAGDGVYKQMSGTTLQFKSLTAGANITLTAGADSIEIAATGVGEANTGSNVGTGGFGVFKQMNGTVLEFKNIYVASSKLSLVDDGANNRLALDLGTVSVLDLNDTPGSFGSPNQVLKVNGTSNALEFGDVILSGSNVGIDGVGVYKQVSGTALQFKNIAPANAEITVVANGDDIDIGLGSFTLDKASDVTITSVATNNIVSWSGSAWVNGTISQLLTTVAPTSFTYTDGTNPNTIQWGDTITLTSDQDTVCIDTATADTIKINNNLQIVTITEFEQAEAVGVGQDSGDFFTVPAALNGWYITEVRFGSAGGTGSHTAIYKINGTGGLGRQVSLTAGSHALINPSDEQVSTGDKINLDASGITLSPVGLMATFVFQYCTTDIGA